MNLTNTPQAEQTYDELIVRAEELATELFRTIQAARSKMNTLELDRYGLWKEANTAKETGDAEKTFETMQRFMIMSDRVSSEQKRLDHLRDEMSSVRHELSSMSCTKWTGAEW